MGAPGHTWRSRIGPEDETIGGEGILANEKQRPDPEGQAVHNLLQIG